MALDKVLKIYDENGNPVDYDILASDVKFLPDGKDLPTKLAEMEAHQGDGTVTGVKVGSDTYEPTEGVVDLSTPFSGKVDKNGTDSLMSAEEHTKLAGIEAGAEKNIIKGIKANGASTNLPVDQNGVVELPPAGSTISPADTAPQMDGTANVGSSAKYAREDHVHPHDTSKLSKSDVSVETQGDGTVDINVKDDTYTINLNHTHEGMAKLEKVTEATLPQTLANDTIYVQVDNLTTPTEIEALHIFGLEFTGRGLPAGTPAITKPSGTSINLGENSGSGVSKAIEIKANSHITGDLTVGLAANSNLSFDTTNLPSGVTYNSGAGTLTIAQATAMQGVNITIVYSGSGGAEIEGGLVISGGGVTPKSVVVVVAVQPLAFWDGADLPSNNKWIDKINNLPINLFGTASHGTNGYQLNNISDQDAAYALSDAANNTFLNQEIDKEFRAIVECSIKFGATSRRAIVLDFGALGEAKSGLSVNAFILQSGEMRSTFKKNGNNLIDGSVVKAQTDITFPVGTYVDVTIEIGARILQSGKQEVYTRVGNAINSKTIDTPVAVSFAGTQENSGAFALGIGYFAGDNKTLNAYATEIFADVIYKSIKIYKN